MIISGLQHMSRGIMKRYMIYIVCVPWFGLSVALVLAYSILFCHRFRRLAKQEVFLRRQNVVAGQAAVSRGNELVSDNDYEMNPVQAAKYSKVLMTKNRGTP